MADFGPETHHRSNTLPSGVYLRSTEGKKQVAIDTGVNVGSKNMKYQNFHAFYSKWHNSDVFQATVKCLTILESSG